MEKAVLETEDDDVMVEVTHIRGDLHIRIRDEYEGRAVGAYITKEQALDISAALAEWAEKVDR